MSASVQVTCDRILPATQITQLVSRGFKPYPSLFNVAVARSSDEMDNRPVLPPGRPNTSTHVILDLWFRDHAVLGDRRFSSWVADPRSSGRRGPGIRQPDANRFPSGMTTAIHSLAKRLKAMGQPKYHNDGDPRPADTGFGSSCTLMWWKSHTVGGTRGWCSSTR